MDSTRSQTLAEDKLGENLDMLLRSAVAPVRLLFVFIGKNTERMNTILILFFRLTNMDELTRKAHPLREHGILAGSHYGT